MKTCLLLLLLLVVVVAAAGAHGAVTPPRPPHHARTYPLMRAPPRPRQDVVIDGKETTIGLAIAYHFRGIVTDTMEIFRMVLAILHPATPGSDDQDYFHLIEENVERVVGDYVDHHNMAQLVVYKDSLGSLLQRYMEAPVTSAIYPDKNTIANSLSTSIIANRFLVEAGERPQSMIIHYADLASIHLLVLKDAAETYTTWWAGVSRWWIDLNIQLDHYISYGHDLQNTIVDWRNDMLDCTYDEGGKYDVWTVVDRVEGITDICRQLHGTNTCDNHCQAYQVNMNRKVSQFVWEYMGKALAEWEGLKVKATQMAAHATRYYKSPVFEKHH
ncbi:uncharacterized protein [Panulirus ornatus]|uniref:uncharacterized protein n=1 Tax=Panulirus ornatus TaxID=150431 RepID=UPI003A897B97